jgi:SAM-dependent methyltransferase
MMSGPFEERLVKSDERVRDLGEVFTPSSTVQAMLDLLPASLWKVHPSPTFLEPACGDGNFLVAILERKLEHIGRDYAKGRLPAGSTAEAAQFHALEALAAIYAVDISIDNVVGGTPGHEFGARTRLLSMFIDWNEAILSKRLTERTLVLRAAAWIVEHNIIVGNMLPFDAAGQPTGRDHLPLIDYEFDPATQSVVLMKTTMGDVVAAEEAKSSSMPSLFGPPAPEPLWSGKAVNLADAERVEAPKLRGPARNGTRRRP